jgi:hypothetical protein
MSNVAPEHGETPFGAVGDGGPLPVGAGSRPPVPHDPIGAVGDSGPSSAQAYTDPGDPDNDMDEESVDDNGV